MEEAEIEKRIRTTHNIMAAVSESAEDWRPLFETLVPAFKYMTREEIIEAAARLCAALDREKLDSLEARMKWEEERKTHKREMALRDERDRQRDEEIRQLQAENTEMARQINERDELIASQQKAMESKDRELADLKDSENTLKEEKYGSKSKRGIGKSKGCAKGRDDNKDDFDGTPGSVSQSDSEGNAGESDELPVSLQQLRKAKSERPNKYKLADAAIKVEHECDLSQLPEGAVLIAGGDTTETIFHEERIIRADIYKFVKYRIQEAVTDGSGNTEMVWREHTMHFPKKKRAASSNSQIAPMSKGSLPGQVPGTHETPAMLANLMFEHYFCNVPMNRISNAFKEFGFRIGRSTLESLDSTVARMLKPLHQALLDDILCDNAVIFCDETWERLHLKGATRKVYDWIVGNKKKRGVAYVYDDGSRGRKVISGIIEGRNIKAIHTDGYNAYYFLSDVGITHICCGAHVWRKIKEWYDRTSDPEAKALLLDLAELFRLDARLREKGAPPEEVLRQRNSPKILDTISRFTARVELLLEKCRDIPKIGFRALNYAKETGSRVFRWREDADYELDNNFAEQSARPIATSRKTSLFHCSHSGAENECIIRSFIETCRLRDVSVTGWFKSFFKAIMQGRTDYPQMLPGILTLD